MDVVKVDKISSLMPKIEALCIEAFPPEELVAPFKLLDFNKDDIKGKFELLAFLDNNEFIGFTALYRYENLSYLAFLAVKKEFRGKGYGSKVLNILKELEKGRVIVAEIENPTSPCDNREERKRREAFYTRAGFETSGNLISYCNVTYSVIYCGGEYKAETFKSMFDYFGKRGGFEFKFE